MLQMFRNALPVLRARAGLPPFSANVPTDTYHVTMQRVLTLQERATVRIDATCPNLAADLATAMHAHDDLQAVAYAQDATSWQPIAIEPGTQATAARRKAFPCLLSDLGDAAPSGAYHVLVMAGQCLFAFGSSTSATTATAAMDAAQRRYAGCACFVTRWRGWRIYGDQPALDALAATLSADLKKYLYHAP